MAKPYKQLFFHTHDRERKVSYLCFKDFSTVEQELLPHSFLTVRDGLCVLWQKVLVIPKEKTTWHRYKGRIILFFISFPKSGLEKIMKCRPALENQTKIICWIGLELFWSEDINVAYYRKVQCNLLNKLYLNLKCNKTTDKNGETKIIPNM